MLHAYVLHARPYRESSQLVDLLTAEHGRLSCVFRAGRRAKHALQLFQPLSVDVAGARELKTLKQCEPAGMLLPLHGVALFSAFYINEITMRLLSRDDVQPGLFLAYASALGQLAESHDPATCLRQYESVLLDTLGYGIDLTVEAETGAPLQAASFYEYRAGHGFVPQPSGFAGDLLLELAESVHPSASALSVLKQIHRIALRHLLGNKPLKSRELFLVDRRQAHSVDD